MPGRISTSHVEAIRATLTDHQRLIFNLLWDGRPKGRTSGELAHDLARRKPEMNKEAVRKALCELRQALIDFAESPAGIAEEYKLCLPLGTKNRPFNLEIERNRVSEATAFWLEHLKNGGRTAIVVGEPLSLSDLGSGAFLRTVGQRWLQVSQAETARYLALSDERATSSLRRYFEEWHSRGLNYATPTVMTSRELSQCTDNVILLGIVKKSHHIFPCNDSVRALLNRTADVAIDHQRIAERAYELWKSRGDLCGSPDDDWLKAEAELRLAGLLHTKESALITRIDLDGDHCVTWITASHPLVLQYVCSLLTGKVSSGILQRVLDDQKYERFPRNFQLALEMTVLPATEAVDSVRTEFYCLEGSLMSRPGPTEKRSSYQTLARLATLLATIELVSILPDPPAAVSNDDELIDNVRDSLVMEFSDDNGMCTVLDTIAATVFAMLICAWIKPHELSTLRLASRQAKHFYPPSPAVH